MRIQFNRSTLDMSVHSIIACEDDDNDSTSSTLDVTDHQPRKQFNSAPQKSVRFPLSANTVQIIDQQQHEEHEQELWYNDKELESMRQAIFQDARELLFHRGKPKAAMCQRVLHRVYKESTVATSKSQFDHSNSMRVIREKLAQSHEQIPDLLGLEKLFVGSILEDCERRRKGILRLLNDHDQEMPLMLRGHDISLPDCLFGHELAIALHSSLEQCEEDDSDDDDSDDEE